jgi:hypothetical protein
MRFGVSARLLLLLAVSWTASGCSKPIGGVSGKVMIGGKPVAGGQISFVASTGGVFTYNIDADGSYRADGLPAGEMTVLVFGPPQPKNTLRGDAGKKFAAAQPSTAPPDGPAVPSKYGDVTSSDLRFTVVAGKNEVYDPLLK